MQDLDVLLAIDRAGLVGADGPTHAGSFDLAYLRCIPNMMIMAASDENECRQMLSTGYQHQAPAAVRYPRGSGRGVETNNTLETLIVGKGEIIKRTSLTDGKKVAILAFGTMVAPSIKAATNLNASVVNMRFIKPIDVALIEEMAKMHDLIVTTEENSLMGGAGSAVMEAMQTLNLSTPTLCLGLPDTFIEHGVHETMLAQCGLDSDGIINSIRNKLSSI